MKRTVIRLASFITAIALLHLLFAAPPFHAVVFATPVLWVQCLTSRSPATRRRLLRVSIPFAVLALSAAVTLVHLNMARKSAAEFDPFQVPLAVYALGALAMTFDLLFIPLQRLARARVRHRAAALVLVLVPLGIVAVPTTFCFVNTHRLRLAQAPAVRSRAVSTEEMSFRTADGLTLRGTLLHHGEPRPGIVFCHGVSANRANFMPYAEELAEQGYAVLIYDARCHGQSEGRRISFGQWEKGDASAAVTWLLARRDVVSGERVVLAGSSMGAATAILAACADERVVAVIAEASFSSLEDIARYRFSMLPDALARAVVAGVSWSSFLQLGVTLDQVDPERALVSLDRELPVLLLHGDADGHIPPEHARRLHAAGRTTQLEIFEGVGHSACLGSRPVRFRRVVGEFLQAHHP